MTNGPTFVSVISLFRILALVCAMLGVRMASAQADHRVTFDASGSEVMGAANLATLHFALYTLQDRHLPDTLGSEERVGGRLLGMGYRTARTLLLDLQLDFLIVLAQHEVFGHGARYREFGYRDNSFNLTLLPPFGQGSGYARTGFLRPGERITPHERLAMNFGGSVGNQVLAADMADRMLLQDQLHYRQALLYLLSRNDLLAYTWRTHLFGTGGPFAEGDIAAYLQQANSLYHRPGTPATDIRTLALHGLVSLLDPLQVYSAWTLVVTHGVQGRKRSGMIPMITLGSVRYLPSFNYTLTPFGQQFHSVHHVRAGRRLFIASLGFGKDWDHRYGEVAVKAVNMIATERLMLNLQANLWSQPELELEDATLRNFEQRIGGMARAELAFHPWRGPQYFGTFLQLGYKSKGYTPGEALAETPVLRFGLRLRMP